MFCPLYLPCCQDRLFRSGVSPGDALAKPAQSEMVEKAVLLHSQHPLLEHGRQGRVLSQDYCLKYFRSLVPFLKKFR